MVAEQAIAAPFDWLETPNWVPETSHLLCERKKEKQHSVEYFFIHICVLFSIHIYLSLDLPDVWCSLGPATHPSSTMRIFSSELVSIPFLHITFLQSHVWSNTQWQVLITHTYAWLSCVPLYIRKTSPGMRKTFRTPCRTHILALQPPSPAPPPPRAAPHRRRDQRSGGWAACPICWWPPARLHSPTDGCESSAFPELQLTMLSSVNYDERLLGELLHCSRYYRCASPLNKTHSVSQDRWT